MPPVVQVIAVVAVCDINVVGVVPVIRPDFWPRINKAEPIAVVLETWISAHNQEWKAIDPELMLRPKASAETVVRNAVAVIAATLLPTAVV
jgi:hypothetical protein